MSGTQWFRFRKPKDPAGDFKGKRLKVYPTAEDATRRTNGQRVDVEHIAGNLRHQTMFQVNGKYLVSMLDAYCELNNEPLPPREMHEAFLSTVATKVEVDRPKPTLIDRHAPASPFAAGPANVKEIES
jgi:hypothetical protein